MRTNSDDLSGDAEFASSEESRSPVATYGTRRLTRLYRKRPRRQWRRPRSTNWRIDETYVKVRGKWEYHRLLYLADAQHERGETLPCKALADLTEWEKPTIINSDKAPTYAAALAELKKDGVCPRRRLAPAGEVPQQRR
jgi:transposase-like protein